MSSKARPYTCRLVVPILLFNFSYLRSDPHICLLIIFICSSFLVVCLNIQLRSFTCRADFDFDSQESFHNKLGLAWLHNLGPKYGRTHLSARVDLHYRDRETWFCCCTWPLDPYLMFILCHL